jgi:hypothetical protein
MKSTCKITTQPYGQFEISASAVDIGGTWFPIFKVQYGEMTMHPWQVPEVLGSDTPELATNEAIEIAIDMLRNA